MVSSARHFVAAWIVIVGLFVVYLVAVVPWIEPPGHALPERTSREGMSSVLPAEMARHFAPTAWERQGAKVLLTRNGALIFRRHQADQQGRITVRPCTLVLFVDRQRRSRPVIIRAPQGATLRFDGPLRLAGGPPARFLGGQLEGQVTFERAPSAPGARDGFHADTEVVRIGPGRIWTTNAVSFRFGPHYGSGRQLLLQLEPAKDRSGLRLGKPISMELVQLDQLVFEIPPRAHRSVHRTGPLDASLATASRRAPGEPTTLQLKCQGSFLFDFPSLTATLERAVQGYHFAADGTIDRLAADRLEIGLVRPAEGKSTGGRDKSRASNDRGLPLAAGYVRSLKLVGAPAVLDAPSEGLACRGSRIEVDHTTGILRLEDREEGRLRFAAHEIAARDLTYRMPLDNPKQLGRLTAPGPGRYRQYRKDGVIEAQWSRSADMRPDGPEHLLSIEGQVRVTFGQRDYFAGERIDTWLRQTGEGVEPTRLRADQDVAFAFRGMTGRTELVEAWFESARGPGPVAGRTATGQPPVAAPIGTGGPGSNAEAVPRYDARGDVIRLQLERSAGGWQIRQGQVTGRVALRQPPANRVLGDVIDFVRDAAGWYRIDLTGRPARIVWDGTEVVGASMHLDQGAERLWMEGAGRMTLPVRAAQAGGNADRAAPPTPVTVGWDRRMEFDGKVARFFDRVAVDGRFTGSRGTTIHQVRLSGGTMNVTVDPPVDFRAAKGSSPSALSHILFPQEVVIEHSAETEGRLVGQDRLHLRDLWVDIPSGRFGSQHPGWGESHRFARPPATGAGDRSARSAAPRQRMYLRIDFQKEMAGNYQQRVVRFFDQVKAIVGPVADWNERLDPNQVTGLGPQAFLLRCNRLAVAQTPGVSPPAIELLAEQRVRIDGQLVSGFGERLTYQQAKDVVSLSGTPSVPARLRYRPNPAAPYSDYMAGSIRYSPRSGQLISTGIRGATVAPMR